MLLCNLRPPKLYDDGPRIIKIIFNNILFNIEV